MNPTKIWFNGTRDAETVYAGVIERNTYKILTEEWIILSLAKKSLY